MAEVVYSCTGEFDSASPPSHSRIQRSAPSHIAAYPFAARWANPAPPPS